MYNLHLSPEQLEIRDTVRDFVAQEIKPVALNAQPPRRLRPALLADVLDKASQMGLRTLSRCSEELGGAGADALTCCIVAEELAAGDADVAAVLARDVGARPACCSTRDDDRAARALPAAVPRGRPLSPGARECTSPTPIPRSA